MTKKKKEEEESSPNHQKEIGVNFESRFKLGRFSRRTSSLGGRPPPPRHTVPLEAVYLVGFTGNRLSGGDLFGNASSFKTINRDNFINFAAEISPDLGRVILIRSAGSRRGTSSSAQRSPNEERRERKRERRVRIPAGPLATAGHCGRNLGPDATNLPLPGTYARSRPLFPKLNYDGKCPRHTVAVCPPSFPRESYK